MIYRELHKREEIPLLELVTGSSSVADADESEQSIQCLVELFAITKVVD